MFKKAFKNNPYIFSYLSLALLCCIGLSILFLYINIENIKKTEQESNQKKLELIMNDLDTQRKTFKKINMKIQANSAYKPINYELNKYNEKTMIFITHDLKITEYVDKVIYIENNTTTVKKTNQLKLA